MESEPATGSATLKLVGSRRAAREGALRALYKVSVGHVSPQVAIADALAEEPYSSAAQEFLATLVDGVTEHRTELDGVIGPLLAAGWETHRIPFLDLCVLRIAAYELYYLDDVPPKVSINEAVLLAKKYGTADSSKFVNGVLGAMLPASPKAQWTPPAAQEIEALEPPEIENVEEETVNADSPEFAALSQTAGWTLRKETSKDQT